MKGRSQERQTLLGLLIVVARCIDGSNTTTEKVVEGLHFTWPRGELHLVVDPSGFKVYGDGEWTVHRHGWSQRRTWRQLQLGVNAASSKMVAAKASTISVRAVVLGELLAPAPVAVQLAQVSGDGPYDS